MSATKNPSTEFITISYLRDTLGIVDETVNESKLQDISFLSNQEIDARLRPHLGGAPLDTTGEVFVQAKKAAGLYGKSLWYEHLSQLERAEYADKLYEKKIEAVITAIKADKPERDQAVFIAGRDPRAQTFQHYNIDEYITREFG